jgi:arylsulfatase
MGAINRILAISVLASLGSASAPAQEVRAGLDRTVLPVPAPRRPTYTELDVRSATPPPHFEAEHRSRFTGHIP